jgi:adenylate kinase
MDNSQEKIVNKIALLGLPGSGKGTQGEYLSHLLSVPHISIGDIVRKHIHNKTELGKKIEAYLGGVWKPLPDNLAVQIAKEALTIDSGWIIDGFPRNIDQVQMADFIENIDLVIYLNVSDEESFSRFTNRARLEESQSIWYSRMVLERERLSKLVEYMKTHFQFIEIDANQSIEVVNASIQQHIQRGVQ